MGLLEAGEVLQPVELSVPAGCQCCPRRTCPRDKDLCSGKTLQALVEAPLCSEQPQTGNHPMHTDGRMDTRTVTQSQRNITLMTATYSYAQQHGKNLTNMTE